MVSGSTANAAESAVVRFAGDSGDGMQLAGQQFTQTTALYGNDLATFPDYPAEIRAPAGSLAGVSAFQIHFSKNPAYTAGDRVDVLVALNPAALRTNLPYLRSGGTLIADVGAFSAKNNTHAGYDSDPLEGDRLNDYRVIRVDMTERVLRALEDLDLHRRDALRCRNFFALGLVYWMFQRDPDVTLRWIDQRFAQDSVMRDANRRALTSGFHYGETTELAACRVHVDRAPLPPGLYRNLSGNEALSLGLMTAAELSGLDLFLASYPITPASDILHFLAKQRAHGVRVMQAEDEIAAACAAIGAAYAGALAVTATSGPGFSLKSEAMGFAVTLELPLLIVDVQRAGPSTGMPTKPEQADLTQALYGRSGEAPLPVLAARSPGDCFGVAIEAARIATRYMTPVVILSDASIANGAEPWRVPKLADIAPITVTFARDSTGFQPYARDQHLARPWAVPGTPGLAHRIGGLEKAHRSGNVSYDAENHELMSRLRAQKVAKIGAEIPPSEVFGDRFGDLLVIGWGGTFGAIREAVSHARAAGHSVSHLHLRHLHPTPPDLDTIADGFTQILVPELNLGQLAALLRGRLTRPVVSHSQMQGRPLATGELEGLIARHAGVTQ